MDFSLRSLLDMVMMMIKEFIRALLSQKAIIASKEDEKKNREGVQSLSSCCSQKDRSSSSRLRIMSLSLFS